MHNPVETHCIRCDVQLIHVSEGQDICPECGRTNKEHIQDDIDMLEWKTKEKNYHDRYGE